MSECDLQVTGDSGSSNWKLTWQSRQKLWPERHYHVDAKSLKETGKEVRAALQDVIDAARYKDPLGPAMKALARAGAEFRRVLFIAEGEGQSYARQIRDTRLPGCASLLVSLSPKVYIPWGLAYDGDPEQLPDNPSKQQFTPELYAGFWCLKYRLCTLYEIADASGVEKPRSNDEVQMLTVVNKGVWDTAEKELVDRPIFDSSLARSGPLITSSLEFFKTFNKRYREIDLLYVYCHANGTKLVLSGEDEITATKFKTNVHHEDREPHPACLVFLNGCQTAIGSEEEGFMKATGGPGFCGFIGTEAQVPDLFAMRFAARFFAALLYEQITVADLMDRLRRQHWPLGLAYSTCCHPMFQIKKIMQPPVGLPSDNICDDKLQVAQLV